MDDPNMHAYGEGGPTDAEIGRQWRENSSLEKWFPITAELLAKLTEQLACVRQALPVEWRDSVPSVAVATLVAELDLMRAALVRADLQLGDGHLDAARRTLDAAMDTPGTATAAAHELYERWTGKA